MPDEDTRTRMAALEKRLAERRRKDAPAPQTGQGYSGAEVAWRMVIEMTVGIGLGLGIGYGLDSLFGTMPFLLILFTMLGFAAGINVMMRTAKEMNRGEDAPEAKRDDNG